MAKSMNTNVYALVSLTSKFFRVGFILIAYLLTLHRILEIMGRRRIILT